MKEICQKQEKYPRITGTVTFFYFLSLTEFLPCFFQVEFIPPPQTPGGDAFGQNIYPCFLAKIFTSNSLNLTIFSNKRKNLVWVLSKNYIHGSKSRFGTDCTWNAYFIFFGRFAGIYFRDFRRRDLYKDFADIEFCGCLEKHQWPSIIFLWMSLGAYSETCLKKTCSKADTRL